MMQKENIAICWLYSDLLDLYGDWGNLLVLAKRLEQLGIASEITRLSISDQLDFTAYDMVYIGPGKARNLKKQRSILAPIVKLYLLLSKTARSF